MTNNTYLEYQFNDRLKVVGRFSFTQQTTGTEEFLPASHSSFRNILASSTDEYLKRGSYTSGHGKYASVSGDLNLQYNQTWGRHALFANAGVNIEQNKSENYIYSAVGFPNALRAPRGSWAWAACIPGTTAAMSNRRNRIFAMGSEGV